MRIFKSLLPLSTVVILSVFTNIVLAAEIESTKSNDSTKLTASPVDTENYSAVAPEEQQENTHFKSIEDTHNYYRKQFEERRLQAQEAQLEAYKQFLERRKQYSAFNNAEFNDDTPAYIQEMRKQFLLEMEERRAYHVKMMEEHRKAADEKRKAMQLKMHQTDSACEDTKKV